MDSPAPRFPVAVEAGGALGAFALSQSVLDHAPVGMLIAAGDGRIVWSNAAMSHVLGVAHTHLAGRHLADYVPPADRAAIEADTAALLDGAATVRTREFRWVNPDGGQRWVSAHSSLALDERGATLTVGTPGRPCVIHQLLDVTDRRQAEQRLARAHRELQARSTELERSNEELTQFAYVASHDLSEPLRVIAGHVELLARRYGDQLDDTAREWIGFAVDGCTRMRALIDDLLSYSRVGREPVREQVALGQVLAAAQAQLATSIRAATAHVEAGELPVLTGDPAGLTQLFTNLLANAIKYADPQRPPVIRVAARPQGDRWEITLADNGVGIPAHQRERVFRIFQRLHGRDIPGTGIGLAICRKVVEAHGGTITIADTPGGGTTVTVTLPAVARRDGTLAAQAG